MEERLQKILAAAGVASRREAEKIITAGRVRVNGKVVTELGCKFDADKVRISVDGKSAAISTGISCTPQEWNANDMQKHQEKMLIFIMKPTL